jgi:hypothetical protein
MMMSDAHTCLLPAAQAVPASKQQLRHPWHAHRECSADTALTPMHMEAPSAANECGCSAVAGHGQVSLKGDLPANRAARC